MPWPRRISSRPNLFINRELNWLEFNDRVLREGLCEDVPLLERLKFLAIVSSNLDEFFLVRVAGLMRARAAGVRRRDPAGMTPAAQLAAISVRAHRMVQEQAEGVAAALAALAGHGLVVLEPPRLDRPATAVPPGALRQGNAAGAHAAGRPGVGAAAAVAGPAMVRGGGAGRRTERGGGGGEPPAERIVVVPVPSQFSRWISLPADEGVCLARLDDVIAANVAALLPGARCWPRPSFASPATPTSPSGRDDLTTCSRRWRRRCWDRQRRAAVRLTISARPDRRIKKWLDRLAAPGGRGGLRDRRAAGRRGLDGAGQLAGLREPEESPIGRRSRRATCWAADNLWEAVGDHDVLLFHPYESFDPVVRLVEQAADDPDVLAIKQTLYRTSGDSPIVRALGRAAQNGKEVTVLVELRARFDEARNIRWARRLEDAGCHVIYGIAGYKTHGKAAADRPPPAAADPALRAPGHRQLQRPHGPALLRHRPDDRPTATSPATWRRSSICSPAAPRPSAGSKLAIAPTGLRQQFIDLIDREVQVSTPDRPGLIMAKVNSLQDTEICRALYRASRAGVKVLLNVRGICCLRPGVPGVSENIEVRSIIDRFLEHARIFYFRNGGHEEVYLGSADWMTAQPGEAAGNPLSRHRRRICGGG